MTRRERRELAKKLAADHGVGFGTAFKAVQLDKHWRCVALAAGAINPAEAFTAAANAFAAGARLQSPVFGLLTDQQRAELRRTALARPAR